MALRVIRVAADTSTVSEHDSFAKKTKSPREFLRVTIRDLWLGRLTQTEPAHRGADRVEQIVQFFTTRSRKFDERYLTGATDPAIGRMVFYPSPCVPHGLAHEFLIRGLVDGEHDALQRREIEKLVDFEHAATVAFAKAAQVHQHGV